METGIRFAFARSRYADQVKFHIEDDRETPSVGVEKAQKLVGKVRVDMLAGPIQSPPRKDFCYLQGSPA